LCPSQQGPSHVFRKRGAAHHFAQGLDELSLLEGLSANAASVRFFLYILLTEHGVELLTYSSPSALPSTRIVAKTPKQDFTFPASPPPVADLSSTMPTLATRATLHRSSRCTSFDVIYFHHPGQAPEGFSVNIRMRSSACPHLPWVRSYDDRQSQSPVRWQP
ncbi:hypothetical protein H4582DRAFT_2009628, partial [Lactarius indigo]